MRKTIIIAASLIGMLGANPANAGYFSLDHIGSDGFAIRFNIALGEPKKTKTCQYNPAKRIANTILWSLSNRLLRGEDQIGGQSPLGATMTGFAVGWLGTGLLYGLSPLEITQHIAMDFTSEQIAPWADDLDIGIVSGNEYQETVNMGEHMTRSRIGSMTLLGLRQGYVSDSLKSTGAFSGLAYLGGKRLKENGHIPKEGNLVGEQHYHVAELASGASYGYGIATTLECQRR